MRALRGDHCRCSACHLEFNSTAAFDKHRIGKHSGKRCRTIPEMRRAGMILSSTGGGLPQNPHVYALALIVGAAIEFRPLPYQHTPVLNRCWKAPLLGATRSTSR